MVRGPLAVTTETWLEKKSLDDNLATHVLEIQKTVGNNATNLKEAQGKQKQLYDTHSSKRRLEVGDEALVLLRKKPPRPGFRFTSDS